jgi:hypothetical protein
MRSGLAITPQIPPMLGSLPSRRIGCSPCERLCALQSHTETCVVDFRVAAVYSLMDWRGASLFCLSGSFSSSGKFRSTKKPDKPNEPNEQDRLADRESPPPA